MPLRKGGGRVFKMEIEPGASLASLIFVLLEAF